jgi:muramoyltetrapeptide carboxypeptidase LdcA involved in peptidoglycan recycling
MRFPKPLTTGDVIGVTSPSSGVAPRHRARLEAAIASLRDRGFEVVVGDCMSADRVVSAPKEQRAAELVGMLTDPGIAAVVPPWGGELAIDVLDQLDWDALAVAEPTWLVGYSDMSTVLLPLTLRTGWATLHGWSLMDTPFASPHGMLHWVDLASATGAVTQRSIGRYKTPGRYDFESDPALARMRLDAEGSWTVVGGGDLEVSGRLIGGCLETLGPLAGTPYGDVAAFGRAHADEGLIVYLEACEDNAHSIGRVLHGLRLAGWFEHASAILIGRTEAPPADDLTQRDAVLDALGMLDVPLVLDVECGHVQPFLSLVNGALARVVVDADRREITQTFA